LGSRPGNRRRGPAGLGATLIAGVLLVALGGCNPFADPPPCPKVSILKQAHMITLYGEGPERDDADVAFEAELRDVRVRCDHDVDETDGGGIELIFALPIEATRGPAAEGNRLSVPFFVALADPGRQIVAKEVFTADLVFEAESESARTVEEFEQWIPLGPGENGLAYETLVGFQLTQDQLEDSRRRDAR